MYEFFNEKRIVVDVPDCETDGATFIRRCNICCRFVKVDETLSFKVHKPSGSLCPEPNATCSRCGRTTMIFEGYI